MEHVIQSVCDTEVVEICRGVAVLGLVEESLGPNLGRVAHYWMCKVSAEQLAYFA
jgi:hypothetical protein